MEVSARVKKKLDLRMVNSSWSGENSGVPAKEKFTPAARHEPDGLI
jgi:hypothetical protein